jgi:hypothetical protein
MIVKFKLDSRTIPDGAVLLFGIRYVCRGQGENPNIYTYAMLKAGGYWYVTGAGRTPQAAGWKAVERWLESDDREVVWVETVTKTMTLWSKHRFEASHSGMVCGAMIQAPDGSGDQCGKSAGDPVHEPPVTY